MVKKEEKSSLTLVEGQVEQILEKTKDDGRAFHVVRINGEGYFDWDDLAEKLELEEGETVRLHVRPGRWPRIEKIERVSGESGDQTEKDGPPSAVAAVSWPDRETRITRLSCLRSACELLSVSEVPFHERRKEILALADKFVKWVA